MTKFRLLAGLLAAAFVGPAAAAALPTAQSGYYVVVPLGPAKAAAAAEGIDVSLSGSALPSGLVGIPYDGYNFMKLLTVTGDTGYTGYGVKWSVVSGGLPEGLTLNADGTLTGTPTANGTANFSLRATYKTKSGESSYQILVGKIVIDIASGTPPQAIVGLAYSYDLKPLLKESGDPAYTGAGVTWSVVSSSLAPGLALRADGTISGTPTASGTGTVVARATYRNASGEQAYEVVSLAINVGLAAGTPPQAIVGQAYSYDLKNLLTVSGDNAYNGSGVTWAALSDNLPAGLSLRADGTITGMPTAAGDGFITVRASYRGVNNEQAYEVVTLAINVALAVGSPPQAIVGQAYVYDLKSLLSVTGDNAYNGSGVTWGVVSSTLPAGLSLRADGTVAGTPTASGTGNITARATYRGVNGQQTYQVVSLGIIVTLATGTPAQAIVGQAYNFDIKPLLNVSGDSAYNGSGVTWSVVSSTLPAGLQLNADGTIGGMPTAAGTGNVVARATYRGVNGQQTYQVVSLAINVALASGTPPQAIVGQAYSYDLKARLSITGDSAYNGSGVTWSVVSSTLPAGLQLNAGGTIGGTPTASGTGSVTARATYRNVNGDQVYQVVSLAINVSLAAGTPPQAIVGQAYTYDLKPLLTVSGDNAYNGSGVTWTVVSNNLAAGLQLNADGTISGTPTAAGTGTLTARAAYRGVNGQQGYQVVTLGISVALATGSPPQAITGQAYSYDLKPLLTVSGDPGYNGSGVTWSVMSSSLPAGLQLLSSGVISGTPTGSGTGNIVARATYRGVNGQQTYQVVTLAINVTLAAATLPQVRVGESYSYDVRQNLAVSGDSAYNGSGVTWSVVSTSLPAGLYLNGSGVIVGTPSVSGSGAVTARATYRNVNGQQSYSVTALPAWTYAWNQNGWSTPAACGSTTSTCSVWCQREDGTTVADASCTGTKPATTQAATDYSACTYSWQSSAWATPAACGSTTSTRSVSCLRSDGTTVSDASCPGTKPANTQATTNYSSCTYSWTYGAWSTPSACGTVTQTRSATCTRSDGAAVSSTYCSGSPVTSQSTTNYSSCSYSFSYGGWASCSASCGGGTQTRSASCVRSDGTTVANSNCGTPVTSQSCNTQACYTYSWSTGAWSTPAACGSVTQTRSVSCIRSDGASVSGSYCPGSAPASSQTGTDYSSCSYSFSYGAWGSCSASCGGGTQTRSASCIRSDGATVSNSSCGTPVTSQSCNTQACAAPAITCKKMGSQYQWSNNPNTCYSNSTCSTRQTCF